MSLISIEASYLRGGWLQVTAMRGGRTVALLECDTSMFSSLSGMLVHITDDLRRVDPDVSLVDVSSAFVTAQNDRFFGRSSVHSAPAEPVCNCQCPVCDESFTTIRAARKHLTVNHRVTDQVADEWAKSQSTSPEPDPLSRRLGDEGASMPQVSVRNAQQSDPHPGWRVNQHGWLESE